MDYTKYEACWLSLWPKPVANLINKYYNIISFVGLSTYKCVFTFVYFTHNGMTFTKILIHSFVHFLLAIFNILQVKPSITFDHQRRLLPTLGMQILSMCFCSTIPNNVTEWQTFVTHHLLLSLLLALHMWDLILVVHWCYRLRVASLPMVQCSKSSLGCIPL